jgi:hypothetical protein
VEAARRGHRVAVKLRRGDEFAGRCAGKLVLRAGDGAGHARGIFSFGDRPPPDGPASRSVSLELGPTLREALVGGATAKLTVAPYHAFAERARLRLR